MVKYAVHGPAVYCQTTRVFSAQVFGAYTEMEWLNPLLMTLTGGGLLAVVILNWDGIFEQWYMEILIELFGRTAVRIFYGVIGLIFLLVGSVALHAELF